MKAWLVEKHGGPEALKIVDRNISDLQPMEARVKVNAVGLNHLDLWVRNGVPGHQFPLPLVPGCDVVGTVDSLGPLPENVAQFLEKRGIRNSARILVNPIVTVDISEQCFDGFAPICPTFGILGEHRDGGCAEFVNVPVGNLLPLPDSVSDIEAASLPIAYMTAWSMLTRKVDLRPGEWALIQAGGSGVSIAAIQIAKLLGATVVTTVGSEEKEKKAKALGADYVINYKKNGFREELKSILKSKGRRGVEVAVDHVGADTFQDSLKSLAWGGRFVTCGATSGSDVSIDLKLVFFKNLTIYGATMGGKGDLEKILRLIADKKIKAVIDSEFEMKDLPKAFEKLETGSVFGKVVVKGFA